jgi:hypothetical protein
MNSLIEKIKGVPMLKTLGLVVLAIVVLFVAVWFVRVSFRTAFYGTSPMGTNTMYDQRGVYPSDGYGGGVVEYPESYKNISSDMMMNSRIDESLSIRNIDFSRGTVGSDAEEYEITSYYGDIQTPNLNKTCDKIEDLKKLDYVVFENSNRDEKFCNYSFKVENKKAEEVLAVVKDLDPENFNKNVQTVKPIVDDYTSAVQILEKKLASLEKTLTDAQNAYDEVIRVATRNQDVESLAKIVDSKIQLIERLTTERINIKNEIDRLNLEKQNQLDGIKYTFFTLNVSKTVIVDGEYLKNSWIYELQGLVNEFNMLVQDITTNLAGYLFQLFKVALYLLIALVVVKYGWYSVKKIWKM